MHDLEGKLQCLDPLLIERRVTSRSLGPTYKRYTPATITSPAALRRHLVLVRQNDVAYDLQEFASGACCIAAPIRDGRNGLVATLGISVPARRFEAEQKQLVKVIRDLAAEASAELGPATGATPLRPPEASRPSPGGGACIA